MDWPQEQLYERIVARDPSIDGAFLVCVTSTGIYCLPSCKAKKPMLKNIVFCKTEKEARAAGFRPCRVCRPDLFYAGEDRDKELYEALVARAAPRIAFIPDVTALAELCGVGGSKLNDLFRRHAHGTPAAFLRSARVASACRLLHETADGVLEIGLAVGFESASTFYRQFRDHVGLSPRGYRELAGSDRFELRLPNGYDPRPALLHAAMDPGQLAERVDVGQARIQKAVTTADGPIAVEVTLRAGVARCVLYHAGPVSTAARVEAHAAVLKMLGLASRAAADFEARSTKEAHVGGLIGGRLGFRLPQTLTAFEALVWAIVGQQISIRFAAELRRVLILAADRRTPLGLWAHPTPEDVVRLDIADLTRERFSCSKAEYMIDTARAIAAGELPLEGLAAGSAEGAQRRMRKLRGIGVWTARYTLLRGARFADFAPIGDSGLAAGLQRLYNAPRRPPLHEVEQLMLPFSPHRSLATAHLWALVHDRRAHPRSGLSANATATPDDASDGPHACAEHASPIEPRAHA